MAKDRGDLHIPACPAHTLLPQAIEAIGFFSVDDRVRIKNRTTPTHLGSERGEGIFREGGRKNLPPHIEKILPGVQLRTAGEAG